MGKLTISMAIFNSYFDITRGYHVFQCYSSSLLVGDSSHSFPRIPGVFLEDFPRVFSYCSFLNMYIYIYGPVLRLSTHPMGWVPGSTPTSLLFASYWWHF